MVRYPEAAPRPTAEQMEEHFRRYKLAAEADKAEQAAALAQKKLIGSSGSVDI